MATAEEEYNILATELETSGEVTVEFEECVLEDKPADNPYARAMSDGNTLPTESIVEGARKLAGQFTEDENYDSAVIRIDENRYVMELYSGNNEGEPEVVGYGQHGVQIPDFQPVFLTEHR